MSLPSGFAGWDATIAWEYDGVVTTWRLVRDGEAQFLKVRKLASHHYTLADERDRLDWLRDRITVPGVLGYGVEDDSEWLLLAPLPGRDATHADLKADPAWLVPILARGLRAFHDALDVEGCPFDFRNDVAIDHVRRRLAGGIFDGDYEFHDEFTHLTPAEAVARLDSLRPESEDLVVCHGDYCFPNVLLDDGKITGYLDVGELGVADRWCDVAVGAWSTTWNVGPGYEDLFYQSYGIEPDPQRIEFYRLLYSLAS